MGAHILLIGAENFATCTSRGVYGCVLPSTERNRAEVVAGVLSVQLGDFVFFYVKSKGIYGVWKVTGDPYYDETAVWSNPDQLYPFRINFEPSIGAFPKPVSLNDVLDLRDKGRIWSFDLNPVQQKNQYKITSEESRELIRLLLRNNPIRQPVGAINQPFVPKGPRPVQIDLTPSRTGGVRYEGWLNAWFMYALAHGQLRAIFGDYREFLNLVPTTFNKVMDIFLTHVTKVDSMEICHKFTCVELKSDDAGEQDLTQILRYEDWISRRLAAGDPAMVQSVLVARTFSTQVIDYVNHRVRIEEKGVRLLTYSIADDRAQILLTEI